MYFQLRGVLCTSLYCKPKKKITAFITFYVLHTLGLLCTCFTLKWLNYCTLLYCIPRDCYVPTVLNSACTTKLYSHGFLCSTCTLMYCIPMAFYVPTYSTVLELLYSIYLLFCIPRACYVLECGGGLAQDVITTIGQAFELRWY